ncbi:rhomboid-related protein 2-like isoform X2 [Ctenocephalides felis]|uniref:rhomboid-related protein 2-like isoform X2 n=1 Tax=Ctenocephalides felis TaxID=7515 RepID=UPI000E6E3E84|nr:rhomboid-related protein 2-like isoform X2 [Ctenocephalides felis]XP_026466560.1 rhomboid-related protein 2-like isoform X2 [Ctenocephalides felis]
MSLQHQISLGERGDAIPLSETEAYVRQLFNKYDTDGDGKISIEELQAIITSREYENDLPPHTARNLMTLGDTDQSGYLNFDEFHKLIRHPKARPIFGYLIHRFLMEKYVLRVVPRRHGDTVDGDYEDQYSCCPPPFSMILFSIIEIVFFLCDIIDQQGQVTTRGPLATLFIYNPFRRYEAWRFATYMFVHAGYIHLIVNLLVQILLGVALECVHHWWRVVIIYLSGVVAGSLGTSITDPSVYLAGASGGVYALITAHVATIVMNWKEMEFAFLQLCVFLVIILVDVGSIVYSYFTANVDKTIGYMAHLSGAIAGLLVGIGVLRNLDVRPWEKKLWWAAIVLYSILMLTAILFNIFNSSYFLTK